MHYRTIPFTFLLGFLSSNTAGSTDGKTTPSHAKGVPP